MKCLLAVGACYLDTILTVPHYPGEDEKLRAQSISRRRGGNCPNSLEVLQQLLDAKDLADIRLAMCATLPSQDSNATEEIHQSLPGIDLSHCIYRQRCMEAASSYIIKSAQSSSRTIVNYNELPEMTFQEFKSVIDEIGRSTGWCHFEGRIPDVALQCIRYLKKYFPGVHVSVEVEKPGRPGLEDMAAEAHLVFFSKSWAANQGYTSAKKCLEGMGDRCTNANTLCCTWGADGAVAAVRNIAHRQSWEFMSSSSQVSPDNVVDTVGAGDTFVAGILKSIISNNDVTTLSQPGLDFAVHLAGLKVQQEGFRSLANRN